MQDQNSEVDVLLHDADGVFRSIKVGFYSPYYVVVILRWY